jgi:hypothetical protein
VTKIAGSGSGSTSQRHGSADLDPDPPQNVMDPQHWVQGLTCRGIEPGPPAWEASTLEKSHLDSLFAGYSELLLGLRLASHIDLYTTFLFETTALYKHLNIGPNTAFATTVLILIFDTLISVVDPVGS